MRLSPKFTATFCHMCKKFCRADSVESLRIQNISHRIKAELTPRTVPTIQYIRDVPKETDDVKNMVVTFRWFTSLSQ